jgi:hypothetical protein
MGTREHAQFGVSMGLSSRDVGRHVPMDGIGPLAHECITDAVEVLETNSTRYLCYGLRCKLRA